MRTWKDIAARCTTYRISGRRGAQAGQQSSSCRSLAPPKWFVQKIEHPWVRRTAVMISFVSFLLSLWLAGQNSPFINTSGAAPTEVHQLLTKLASAIPALIIIQWMLIAPVFYRKLQRLELLYQDCGAYKKLLQAPSNMTTAGGHIIYSLGWLVVWGIIFCTIFNADMLQLNACGRLVFVLFAVSVCLNYSSYYRCIVLARFITKASGLTGLRHNEYRPGATWEFQKLQEAANLGYLFFLLDSMLCLVYYILMCMLSAQTPLLLTLITVSMSAISFLFLFFSLIYSGWKLHSSWKNSALYLFQDRLYQARKRGDADAVHAILADIDQLLQDRYTVSGSTIVIAVSTLLVNIAAIIYPVVLK